MTRRKIKANVPKSRKDDLDPDKDKFVTETLSIAEWAYERRRPIALVLGFALVASLLGIGLDYLQENEFIANAKYRELNAVSHKTAHNELSGLMSKGLVRQVGQGRTTRYTLISNEKYIEKGEGSGNIDSKGYENEKKPEEFFEDLAEELPEEIEPQSYDVPDFPDNDSQEEDISEVSLNTERHFSEKEQDNLFGESLFDDSNRVISKTDIRTSNDYEHMEAHINKNGNDTLVYSEE